jgi:alpha-amylase
MSRSRAVSVAILVLFLCGSIRAQGRSERRGWEDEIVYVVIVSKFFDGEASNNVMLRRYGKDRARYEGGFWGGDLQGAILKLDYLKSIGITALLLYPVMDNDDGPFGKYLATGYPPRDYFRVDENFGDLATLRRLVDEAHRRGLRVILDLPLGMPGVEHPYYADPARRAWFGAMTAYGVRQWDADVPAVAEYLIKVSRFWREQSGCDGFRLDSAPIHSTRFWKDYAHAVRGTSAPEDFVLLAEVPLHPEKIGRFVTETGLDGAYDFSFGIVRDVIGRDEPVGKLSFVFGEAHRYYPRPRRMIAQVDNYEDPTFLAASRAPKPARARLALALLLTCDRVPFLYSGDEAALDYRETGALFTDREGGDPETLAWTRRLCALRREHRALRRGRYVEVKLAPPLFGFFREDGPERLLVILNPSADRRSAILEMGEIPRRERVLRERIGDRPAGANRGAGPIEIGPFEARIFVVE